MAEKKENEGNPKIPVDEMQRKISKKFLQRPGVLAVGTARVGDEMKLQVFVDNPNSQVVQEIQKYAQPHLPEILPRSKALFLNR